MKEEAVSGWTKGQKDRLAVVPPGQGENASEYFEIHDNFGRTATVYGEPEEARKAAELFSLAPDLADALRAIVEYADNEPRASNFYAAKAQSILARLEPRP